MNRLTVWTLRLFFGGSMAVGVAHAAPNTAEFGINDDGGARVVLNEVLSADARKIPYLEITGEIPRDFTVRVVSLFRNERPSYPICTQYTLGGPSPLSLERYVAYKVTSQTGYFRMAVPLDYSMFKAPLSSFCAPWLHSHTRIGLDYLGKRVLLTDLGIVRAATLKMYDRGEPLVTPIEIVCSKKLLESGDKREARKACKTVLGPQYSWWFGLTEDFIAIMPSVQDGFSAPRPLTIRIQVAN